MGLSRPCKRAYTEQSNAFRPDFLRFMLENNHPGGMTRDEIDATSSFLVLAGSDTTALTMSSVIYFSLKHPHVMEKLQKEVRDAFGTNQSTITSASASELSYMHAAILEALRMHSPGAISVPREVNRPGIVVSGKPIPVGVSENAIGSFKGHFLGPTDLFIRLELAFRARLLIVAL